MGRKAYPPGASTLFISPCGAAALNLGDGAVEDAGEVGGIGHRAGHALADPGVLHRAFTRRSEFAAGAENSIFLAVWLMPGANLAVLCERRLIMSQNFHIPAPSSPWSGGTTVMLSDRQEDRPMRLFV